MKAGRSLAAIAAELERQVTSRKDYIAPQGKLVAKVAEGSNEVVIDGLNGSDVGINGHAHSQLSDHLGIPKRYYDRMKVEQPALLAANVNAWFQADAPNKRLVRTLDNRVRGFLSPKFRPLDNFDLASAILPKLFDMGAEVQSSELTETRFYIKAILPTLSDVLPEGLTWGEGHHIFNKGERRVVSAIVISNSDVGAGTLRIEPSVYTALCTNLAVLTESAMRKYHIGRGLEASEDFSVYRDETRQADDKAFWLKVQDVAAVAFSPDRFRAAIDRIKYAGEQAIKSDDLPTVVEVATQKLALPEGTKGSILTWLARGGQLNQWGLSSAVTRAAQDVESYEAATDMERAGGEILALTEAEWKPIAEAVKKAS